MKLPHFFLFIISCCLCQTTLARRLNYIEAHNLRLSSQTHSPHWINPFVFNKNLGNFEVNTLVSGQKDVLKLYNDIESKDEQKIIDRLEESFGKPYDLSAKISVGLKVGSFSQF